jgi:glycosyltransferase involved in cell wall biosynthesis
MHQYRAAYELCGTEYSDFEHTERGRRPRDTLFDLDGRCSASARRLFTNRANTAARLAKFNGIAAEPLYHPPRLAARLRPGPYGDYVLSVGASRASSASTCRAGDGARRPAHPARGGRRGHAARQRRALAGGTGRADRVTFLGTSTTTELIELYAGALAVVYPPFDEDFGYVTLEAFLARQAGRHCTDSRRPARVRRRRRQRPGLRARAGRCCLGHQCAGGRPGAGGRRARAPPGTPSRAAHHLGRRDREARGCAIGEAAIRGPMTKLIIQIPCLNEAETLPATLADLPRHVPGIDVVEVLVIDDGSRDGTAEVARPAASTTSCASAQQGARRGLRAGIDAASRLGADFIVNTDADNQYTAPTSQAARAAARGEADICIGDRNIATLAHMSWPKQAAAAAGQLGRAAGVGHEVPDTTSGFRAYTREAALRMTIVSEFSYTLESIIQAGKRRMAIAHVEVATNPRTRQSRLFDSVFSYIKKSAATIVRIYAMYEPLKVFSYIGLTIFGAGFLISARFCTTT